MGGIERTCYSSGEGKDWPRSDILILMKLPRVEMVCVLTHLLTIQLFKEVQFLLQIECSLSWSNFVVKLGSPYFSMHKAFSRWNLMGSDWITSFKGVMPLTEQ